MYHEILPSDRVIVLNWPPEWTDINPFSKFMPTPLGQALQRHYNKICALITDEYDCVGLQAKANSAKDALSEDLDGLHCIGNVQFRFILTRFEQLIAEETVEYEKQEATGPQLPSPTEGL